MTGVYKQFWIKGTGSKSLTETCFCQSGRNPGRNLFLRGQFKPVLAETCQPCLGLLFCDLDTYLKQKARSPLSGRSWPTFATWYTFKWWIVATFGIYSGRSLANNCSFSSSYCLCLPPWFHPWFSRYLLQSSLFCISCTF